LDAAAVSTTVHTAGAGIEVTAPAAGVGTTIAAAGVVTAGAGAAMMLNAVGNASKGYNYGNKEPNGNSKSSTKAQHNYDVKDTETGKTVKTGISGGKETKSGQSYRGNSQANKWNKQENTSKYKPETTNRISAGKGAREKALQYEKKHANEVRNQLDPNKHNRP